MPQLQISFVVDQPATVAEVEHLLATTDLQLTLTQAIDAALEERVDDYRLLGTSHFHLEVHP